MPIISENSAFAQTKFLTDISTILKKNVVTIRKHFKGKASSLEEEPKRLLSSVSKHLMYIFNSHHPLQSKIQELFKTYNNKNKNSSNKDENTKYALDSKDEQLPEDSKDHGIGSNMIEQGMNESNNFVPHLLNISSINHEFTKSSNIREGAEHHLGRYDKQGNMQSKMSNGKYVVPNKI